MDIKNKKILVTGGAGFIGSSLVKRLVGAGADVQVLDNLSRGKLENLQYSDGKYAINLDEKFHNVDLTDYSKCLESIREVDLVYHLADIVGGIHYVFGHEAFVFRQNILINTNVLSACVSNSIPSYIYVGTACSFPKHLQMKDGVVALSEDQTYPAQPESAYGWSKLMGEYEAELAQKSGKIQVGILRFHNVYGPMASIDPKHSQVIPSLINKAIQYPKQPFVVWGSGAQYRDFIYIDDVIEALISMPKFGLNKGVIQIGSEVATSIREVAEKIVQISQKDIRIIFDTSRPEGDRGRVAVCDRAKNILGWKASVNIDEGLRKTYQYVLKSSELDNVDRN